MPSKPLEKDLERKVVAYAKSRNVICLKFASPSNRGVPDRILIGSNGRIAFLELKRPGQTPTALQQHVLDQLSSRQVRAEWTDNLEVAKTLIDRIA